MKFKDLKNRITRSKVNLFIGLSIIGLIIIIILDFFDSQFSFHDIFVEFHGLVFDLFIFGILLTIYEYINSRNEKIERYQEEINDYRFWKSEEAMYRTRGLIKRLVDLKVKNLDISHCYLATDKSFSSYKDMSNWKFSAANLRDSFFLMSNLNNANFYMTNLMDTTFNQVNLTNCKFGSAILYNTKFEKCTFINVDLSEAMVKATNWFDELENYENIGIDLIKEKYTISDNPEVIHDIKMYRIKSKEKKTYT